MMKGVPTHYDCVRRENNLRATIERQAAEMQAREAVAMPEEVRETLLHCLGITLGSVDWDRVPMPRIGKHRMLDARTWLESQPTATDKAVCPMCGKDWPVWSGKKRITCPNLMCAHEFDIQLIVISPPRAPKVTG